MANTNWTDASKFIYVKESCPSKEGVWTCYQFGYESEILYDSVWCFTEDFLKQLYKNNSSTNPFESVSFDEASKHFREGCKLELITKEEIIEHFKSGNEKPLVIFSNISSNNNYLPFGNTRSVNYQQFMDLQNSRPFVSHEDNVKEFLNSKAAEYDEIKKDPNAKYVAKTLDWHYIAAEEAAEGYKHSTAKAVYAQIFITGDNGHYSKVRFWVPRKFARTNSYNNTIYIPYWIIKENAPKGEVLSCH